MSPWDSSAQWQNELLFYYTPRNVENIEIPLLNISCFDMLGILHTPQTRRPIAASSIFSSSSLPGKRQSRFAGSPSDSVNHNKRADVVMLWTQLALLYLFDIIVISCHIYARERPIREVQTLTLMWLGLSTVGKEGKNQNKRTTWSLH